MQERVLYREMEVDGKGIRGEKLAEAGVRPKAAGRVAELAEFG